MARLLPAFSCRAAAAEQSLRSSPPSHAPSSAGVAVARRCIFACLQFRPFKTLQAPDRQEACYSGGVHMVYGQVAQSQGRLARVRVSDMRMAGTGEQGPGGCQRWAGLALGSNLPHILPDGGSGSEVGAWNEHSIGKHGMVEPVIAFQMQIKVAVVFPRPSFTGSAQEETNSLWPPHLLSWERGFHLGGQRRRLLQGGWEDGAFLGWWG